VAPMENGPHNTTNPIYNIRRKKKKRDKYEDKKRKEII